MGGKAKPPKQTDEQQKAERISTELMQLQLAQAKKPAVLPDIKPPAPLPPVAPPVATLSDDVAQAEEDARRRAMKRTNAGARTILAGESGGKKAMKTILG